MIVLKTIASWTRASIPALLAQGLHSGESNSVCRSHPWFLEADGCHYNLMDSQMIFQPGNLKVYTNFTLTQLSVFFVVGRYAN